MASLNNLLTQASATYTASGSSASLNVPLAITTAAVDVNVTAASGTSPTLALYLDRQGADGIWYNVWTSSSITAAGTASTSVGPGCVTGAVLTGAIRLRWVLGGTSPSFTFSASIVGR